MDSATPGVVPEWTSWSPVDLREAVSGNYTGPEPALLQRSDGKHLIYPGKLHSIAGAPGGGKSWIAQVVCAQLVKAGSIVLYIDFEDSADSVVGRLKILGVPGQVILDRFGYVSPSEPLPKGGARELDAWGDAADLVVIDGVTDAMTSNNWNPLDNKDAALFMQQLVRPLGSGDRNPAVLLVDHVTKSSDNRGNYALGAQHKLAAVQAQFKVETTAPFDQDHDGTITLSVTKDRYGQVQRLAGAGEDKQIARFHFKHPIPGDETMIVYIDPPAGKDHSRGLGIDQTMLWNILKAIGHSTSGANKTQIKDLVTGRDATILNGVNLLRDRGLIEGVASGRSTVWTLTHPIEGITPATEDGSGTDPNSEWLSVGAVSLLLNPSEVLPPPVSMPGIEQVGG